MERGVCYVAWGDQCVAEAIASARTAPYSPCLFTDMETVIPEYIEGYVFNHVIRTDFAEVAHLHFFYRKLIAMLYTPFESTLFADSDTRFFPAAEHSIDLGYERAEKYGFAAVLSPGGTFHWHENGYRREFLHINGGTLWFKGRPAEWVRAVMELGKEIRDNDEPAWAIAWERLGINPAILPAVFNHVANCNLHKRPIRVWHSRDPVSYTHLTGSPATS